MFRLYILVQLPKRGFCKDTLEQYYRAVRSFTLSVSQKQKKPLVAIWNKWNSGFNTWIIWDDLPLTLLQATRLLSRFGCTAKVSLMEQHQIGTGQEPTLQANASALRNRKPHI